MANFAYNHLKHLLATAGIDFGTADLRMLLVMSNTTVDTEDDAVNLAGFTTIDEYDGANYARADLAGVSVAKDATNNRSEVTFTAPTFSSLGAGTRQCQAAVVYLHVDGTAANDIPLFYIDTGGFPFDGSGTDVTISPNAEGALQVG